MSVRVDFLLLIPDERVLTSVGTERRIDVRAGDAGVRAGDLTVQG